MIVITLFIIAFLLQLFLPWWIIGLAAFGIAAWQAKSSAHAFKGSFTAISLLWMVVSLWKSLPNENILANRVAQMFMLPDWSFSWILVLLITCILGGLTAGMAAVSGYLVRKAWIKKADRK